MFSFWQGLIVLNAWTLGVLSLVPWHNSYYITVFTLMFCMVMQHKYRVSQ